MSTFYNQPTNLVSGTTARASDINNRDDATESAFDNVEAVTIRSIKLPVGTQTDQIVVENEAQRGSKTLGFNATGALTLYSPYAWRGDWQAFTEYKDHDVIRDPDSKGIYFSTAVHTSSTSFSSDSANWSLSIDVQAVEDQRELAETARAVAEDWAVLLDTHVDGDYSAKEYAIGTTVVGGSAKDWASQESGTVDGVSYSALYMASQATQQATASEDSANESEVSRLASEEAASAADISRQESADTSTYVTSALNSANTASANASASESAAATSATASSNSAGEASTSAATATQQAAGALASAATAEQRRDGAIESAGQASLSADSAAYSAAQAASSSSQAAISTATAESHKNSASSSLQSTASLKDAFDKKYIGSLLNPPSTNIDGSSLQVGAIFYDTSDLVVKIFDGSVWQAAYASLSGALQSSNNLSDITDLAVARTNLGVASRVEVEADIRKMKTLNLIGFYS